MRIKFWNALIVGRVLPSAQLNKNFMLLRDLKMIPSAALNVDRSGSRSVLEALDGPGRCILPYVRNVAPNVKSHLNLEKGDLSTVPVVLPREGNSVRDIIL